MQVKEEFLERWAKRFCGFRKHRWYIDWLWELEQMFEELQEKDLFFEENGGDESSG